MHDLADLSHEIARTGGVEQVEVGVRMFAGELELLFVATGEQCGRKPLGDLFFSAAVAAADEVGVRRAAGIERALEILDRLVLPGYAVECPKHARRPSSRAAALSPA